MIILIQVKNYAPKLNSDSGLKKIIMTLTERGIKRNCPKLTKGIYEECTANMLNGRRLKAFPLKARKKTICPLLQFLFNRILEILVQSDKKNK